MRCAGSLKAPAKIVARAQRALSLRHGYRYYYGRLTTLCTKDIEPPNAEKQRKEPHMCV